MTTEPWSPPGWARLFAYLGGVTFFLVQPLAFPPPNFPLLALDCVVLIGLSSDVFKQVVALVAALFGRTPPSSPPRRESEKES